MELVNCPYSASLHSREIIRLLVKVCQPLESRWHCTLISTGACYNTSGFIASSLFSRGKKRIWSVFLLFVCVCVF